MLGCRFIQKFGRVFELLFDGIGNAGADVLRPPAIKVLNIGGSKIVFIKKTFFSIKAEE
ncbi:MAG: hypothetical protein MUP16_06255 [Sedimentisphaerales bacterium]|nr:hypothetical protein [Sedimentisphaerales bacterium]